MRRTANEVDGEVLFGLNDENLKSSIGIEAYGPRLKIMNAINDLFPGGECEYQASSTAADFFHSSLTYHSQYLPSCRCHCHLAVVVNAASWYSRNLVCLVTAAGQIHDAGDFFPNEGKGK